ncbi:hypothetical protein Poly41_00850 [Novipirellula artificiosorum]|uniref:Uncharacterized protein n=1 Tax=Novipirellula artificiosorum TaxID=2528016 RepID=A0A5C6DWK6_9BACT|nr:hypothetical protein Poly41_00850 [Novipirellula artificiosorum]
MGHLTTSSPLFCHRVLTRKRSKIITPSRSGDAAWAGGFLSQSPSPPRIGSTAAFGDATE